MNRHIALLLALVGLTGMVMATYSPITIWPTGTSSYLYLLGQETSAVVTVAAHQWNLFQAYGIVDSMKSGGDCTLNVCVQWRWRKYHPKYPTTYYYGNWGLAFGDSMSVRDTLYRSVLIDSTLGIAGDYGLGWIQDLQFRAYGAKANDSSAIRVWLDRRTYRD